MKNWSDEEIIVSLQEGEARKDLALKSLYRSLYPVIKSYILKNNGTEEDAADIFQDAIVVFYEKVRVKEFHLSSSIRTYIYSVCKHLWLNKLRAQKRVVRLTDENETITVDSESLAVLGSRERNRYLMKLLNALGEDCKTILVAYYFERLKMKQIANLMNFANDQVAKNKKSSCLKRLKAMVSKSSRLKGILKNE